MGHSGYIHLHNFHDWTNLNINLIIVQFKEVQFKGVFYVNILIPVLSAPVTVSDTLEGARRRRRLLGV